MKQTQAIAIVLFYGLLSAFFADAQIAIKWQNSIGLKNRNESLVTIAPSADGGYLAAGNYSSLSVNNQIVMCKTDSIGNQLWLRDYGGSQHDDVKIIFQCSDGGIIFAGSTGSNDGDVSGNHSPYPFYDAWVVKTDSSGVIQWQRPYGGSSYESFNSGMELDNGDLLFAGSSSSNTGDMLGLNPGLTGQIWLMRCNSTGTIQNQKLIGGLGADAAFDLIRTQDGGFAIAGASQGSGNEIDTAFGSWDITIAKFDSTLSFVWAHVYGGTNIEQAYDLIQTNDGSFVVVGISESNDGYISGNHGMADYCVIKTDNMGNFIWQKSLGGSLYDRANSVIEDSQGNYIIAGNDYGSIDGDISNPRNGYDGWLVCVDSSSALLWEKTLGGGYGDDLSSIYREDDGNIMVGASSSSRDYDVNNQVNPVGLDNDFWLLQLDDQPNSITGHTFVDLNSDQVQDPQEPSLPLHKIKVQNSQYHAYSQSNGFYQLDVSGAGSYITESVPLNYYNAVPINHSIVFSGINQVDSLNDFAMQPSGNFNDLSVTITPATPLRPGFDVNYHLEFTNTGTIALSGSVVMDFPWELTYLSSTTTPNQITTDSLVWQFTGLAPFEKRSIEISFNVTSLVPIGWNSLSIAKIEPLINDFSPENNRDSSNEVVVGSFDPNDIAVDITTIDASQTAPFLEYTIRFQNTGNFPATFVRVTNPLSNKLDMSTFELLATSHTVSCTYLQHSGNLIFFFDNINLIDSTTNEAESHGLIKYRIKPKSPLVVGDTIKNIAYIYFDYNSPVVTNLVMTRIITLVSDNELEQAEFDIYPNPAAHSFVIKLNPSSKARTVEIYSILGERKLNQKVYGGEVSVNTDDFSSGIYFVNIWEGENHYCRKVIIQHE